MKKHYYLFVVSVAFVSIYAVLQTDSRTFEKENQSIEAELEKWDPVRGVWLAESLEAIAENRTIPDRMFPEDLTPYQMISLLPNDLREEVERSFGNDELVKNNTEGRLPSNENQTISRPRPLPQMNQSDCDLISARSYGDPHLVTFDGARYSFQTVGEFVLSRSHAGMEIQTRQSPEKEDFSFNTAVAMNVGGDRVGIYARNHPDGDASTPIRVNGLPVQMARNGKYFLPNGGIIRRTAQTIFTIDWPTGESLLASLHNLSTAPLVNVTVHVTECGSYDGLLGNANGMQSDDFGQSEHQASIYVPSGDIFSGSSEEIERSRLTYIANALGDKYRVTPSTSLFDYPPGTSTYTFTDRNFPRVHRTVEEIPEAQKEEARAVCERSGVSADDMNGCIFDQAYLEIEPAPERRKEDPTEGVVLRPVVRPEPNVNTGPSRPITGGPVTNGTQDRPGAEPTKDERLPIEEIGSPDPKDEVDKEAELREERHAEQYRLEEEERERQREERIRAQEEQDRQDRLQREREEEIEREQREEERIQREKEAEERKEQELREREQREREEAKRKEQEQREAREKKEREAREARRKADEKAKAEAERKRQEEARRKKAAAEKKAREEAARKAKEAAEKKRQEEAAKKTRSGGR